MGSHTSKNELGLPRGQNGSCTEPLSLLSEVVLSVSSLSPPCLCLLIAPSVWECPSNAPSTSLIVLESFGLGFLPGESLHPPPPLGVGALALSWLPSNLPHPAEFVFFYLGEFLEERHCLNLEYPALNTHWGTSMLPEWLLPRSHSKCQNRDWKLTVSLLKIHGRVGFGGWCCADRCSLRSMKCSAST